MSMAHNGHRHAGPRRPAPPPERHPSLPPLKASHQMDQRGTVKFYDRARGYGFIKRQDGQDVFLHSSVVNDYGLTDRQLGRDVPVRFTAKEQPGKRPEADAIAIAT